MDVSRFLVRLFLLLTPGLPSVGLLRRVQPSSVPHSTFFCWFIWTFRLCYMHRLPKKAVCSSVLFLAVPPSCPRHTRHLFPGATVFLSSSRSRCMTLTCEIPLCFHSSTEKYRTQHPRNYKFHEDALQEAFDILSNKARGTKIGKKVPGYVSVSLNVLWQQRSDLLV